MLQSQLFFGRSKVDQLLSIQEPRVGPERAAQAVEAIRSDRMTSRAAAKTFDIFVGSLQKGVVSGGASKADGVGL